MNDSDTSPGQPMESVGSLSVAHLARVYGFRDKRFLTVFGVWALLHVLAVLIGRLLGDVWLRAETAGIAWMTAYAGLLLFTSLIAGVLVQWLGFGWAATPAYLLALSRAITIGTPLGLAIISSLSAPAGLAILALCNTGHAVLFAPIARRRLLRWASISGAASLIIAIGPTILLFTRPGTAHTNPVFLAVLHGAAIAIGICLLTGLTMHFAGARLRVLLRRYWPAGAPNRGLASRLVLVFGIIIVLFLLVVLVFELLNSPTSLQLPSSYFWEESALWIALILVAVSAVGSVLIFYWQSTQFLAQEIARRQQSLSSLNAISAALSRGDDLEHLLQSALQEILRATSAGAGTIHLSYAGEPLALMAHEGLAPQQLEYYQSVPFDHPLVAGLFEEANQATTRCLSTEQVRRYLSDVPALTTVVLLPVQTRGLLRCLIGLVGLPEPPQSADHQLHQSICSQVAIALENAQLLLNSRERVRELTGLMEVSQTLTKTLAPSLISTLQEILRQALELGHAARGCVVKFEQTSNENSLLASLDEGASNGSLAFPLEAYAGLLGSLRAGESFAEGQIAGEMVTALALHSEQASLGGMLVIGPSPTGENRRLLAALADLAAVAVLQSQAYDSERRRHLLAETFSQIARLSNEFLTLNELLSILLEKLGRLVPYDSGAIYLRRGDAFEPLSLAAFKGVAAFTNVPAIRDPAHLSPAAAPLFFERRPVVVHDAHEESMWEFELGQHGVQSWIGIPLLSRGTLLGVLSLCSSVAGLYSELDAELVSAFAEQAASAIDRALIDQRMRRRVDEVTALNEMARSITSMTEPQQILHFIMDQAQELFEAEAASIALIDPATDMLVFEVAVGAGAESTTNLRLPLGQGIAGWVAKTGQPVRVASVRQDTRFFAGVDQKTGYTTRNIMCAPMVVEGRVIGVVEVLNRRTGTFSEDDLNLLCAVSAQVGTAVDRSRLYASAQLRATQMTSLYQASLLLVSQASLINLAQAIVERTALLLDAPGCGLFLMEETPTVDGAEPCLRLVAGKGRIAKRLGVCMPITEGASGRALAQGELLVIEHYDEWEHRSPHFAPLAPEDLVACVPLRWRERMIGTLFVQDDGRRRSFGTNDLQLLELMGTMTSATLENVDLLEKTRRHANELAILLETSRDISSTLEPQAVLELIAGRASRLLDADGCIVFLLEKHLQALRPVVSLGSYSDEVMASLFPLDAGLSGWVATHGEGSILNQAHTHSLAYRVPGTPLEPECLMSVPLLSGQETIGVMTVNREGARAFTEEDLRFLSSLATQASIAIVNARLYEAVRNNAEQLSALQQIAKAINSTLDLQSIMSIVAEQIGRIVPYELVSVALYDEHQDLFYHPFGPGHSTDVPVSAATAGLMRQALEQGHPIVQRPLDLPGPAQPDSWTQVAVPIMASPDRLGGLVLETRRPTGFSPEQVRILSELANHLALAIKNARLYQERDQAFRELEQAQHQLIQTEKLRALGQMASGIAHNFNNILAVVLGRTQLALRRVQDDSLRKDLEAIAQATRDGATTVRRLQEFTRLRPDEKNLTLIDPNDVLLGVSDITRPRWKDQMEAEGRHVRLHTRLSPDLPKVSANPAELREVLTNMIFNALDAMPEGGEITLTTGFDGEYVSIGVGDSGCGMSEETRNRIFDPFFTTKGPQNSGLGLSTSYGIIARHGGEILVESELGRGTSFIIRLPSAEGQSEESRHPTTRQSARASRIMVVDDEEELGTVLQRALREEGHLADAFVSPIRALEAFRQQPYDLVITDLGMPGLSGWDLIASVREIDPNVPILMITGWGDQMDSHLVQQNRVDAVVPKPFDIDTVLELSTNTLLKRQHTTDR